jgi:hypothetical protein
VVSLTAVFFALAIGLVVGTAALNGPAADSLRDQVNALGEQNQEQRDQVNGLTDDVAARDEYARQLAPLVLANRLAGRTVLIMSTGSGTDHVDAVADLLIVAGATVSGRVEVTEQFTDPADNDELLELSRTSPGPCLSVAPTTNGDGVAASSALFGAVLLKGAATVGDGDRRGVLLAYAGEGYLVGAGDLTSAADAVVVVAGPPATGDDAERRNAALVTLVTQLDRAGNVLVAANGDAGDGNPVAHIRADPALSASVSTVDNVGSPPGRLVTAWAVADLVAGVTGHYGIGSGATLLPKIPQ